MGINLSSERRTLLSFLTLYIFLTVIIFSLASFMYFRFEKELALNLHLPKLQNHAKDVIHRIRQMHESLLEDNYYPRYSSFRSAIYDADYTQIFSLIHRHEIKFHQVLYKCGKYIYFIKEPELYYLGAKYVIIEIDDDEKWLRRALTNIVLFGSLFLLFMAIIGYFLVRLFLRPMRNSIMLLNDFIKDTTHELNTPVSTILTNIETIESDDERLLKKIRRIEIAARTIATIYNDLTYLLLHERLPSKIETIDMAELLRQRTDYFKPLAQSKKVEFRLHLAPSTLRADRKKISRLVDNILSNAIKYNKIGGKVEVYTFRGGFRVKDSGVGIPKEQIKEIFERYKRLSKAEGGFGIGMHIVYMIAKEFGLQIKIESELNEYTEVTVLWRE
ncbi:MAG: HAMP domain-containing histidine kinase [Epsilonproteobacteria bacterium]|nr:two-component sensor histidine kinase [Campylobacterota bacterium]NPA57005.1 HAMP domain-containing histidine kinase [Campylobacterota bacterium]